MLIKVRTLTESVSTLPQHEDEEENEEEWELERARKQRLPDEEFYGRNQIFWKIGREYTAYLTWATGGGGGGGRVGPLRFANYLKMQKKTPKYTRFLETMNG